MTTRQDVSRSISDDARVAKNAAISASQKKTRERRKTQTCKVFELKIQANKLTARQREALHMLFVEAKWVYNHCLSTGDVFSYTAGAVVIVKTHEGVMEERELRHIGSQMKQSVVEGIRSSVKSLKTHKAKGTKVGRLKYISTYPSLNLKQYGTTYQVRGAKAKVQNVPGWVRVSGAAQLDGYELANAKLVNRADGYYLKVTAYIDTDKAVAQVFDPNTVVGIDMGVKTHITVSDGQKVNVLVEEPDRLKRLQRKLSRQIKGSSNYEHTRKLIRVEYQKMDRRKDAAAIDTVRALTVNECVVFQDENMSSWKRKKKGYIKGGRLLQHSILGRVKSRLKAHPRAIMLSRWEPTTQLCVCGTKTPHPVGERTFICSSCGHTEDRDIHASAMMIHIAAQRGELPAHLNISTSGTEGFQACGDRVRRSHRCKAESSHRSMKQEAAESLAQR